MQTITINQIPDSIEAFTQMRNSIATTAEGGAAMLVTAMLKYIEKQDLGLQFFTLTLDKGNLSQVTGGVHVKGYAPSSSIQYHIKRLGSLPYLPASYVAGTSPEQGYRLPSPPYKINIFRNKNSVLQEDKLIKVFVECSGADSSRPVTLKKNDKGIWKASECSSLFVGIRKPAEEEVDDL
jgi:hypothetical protein